MRITFRPIANDWQGEQRKGWRSGNTFGATYSQTVDLLDRELFQLGATSAVLQVDASERDCRMVESA